MVASSCVVCAAYYLEVGGRRNSPLSWNSGEGRLERKRRGTPPPSLPDGITKIPCLLPAAESQSDVSGEGGVGVAGIQNHAGGATG